MGTIKSIRSRDAIGPKAARKIADALGVPYRWIRSGATLESLRPLQGYRDEFAEAAKTERTSIRERLLAAQETLGLDSTGFAAAAGITPDDLQTLLERDSIDPDTGRMIARRLGLSYLWIMEGKGRPEPAGSEVEGFIGFDPDQAAETFLPIQPQVMPPAHPRTGFVLIPKAKTDLSGGAGILPEQGFRDEVFAFREDWLKKIGCVRTRCVLSDVDGDSMAPTLLDKDTVLIDRNRTVLREGRIYAISVGDVVQIKRLQRVAAGRIRVISDNPAYHSYEVDAEDISIIGQMVWFGRTEV